jgi:hypothetical protein
MSESENLPENGNLGENGNSPESGKPAEGGQCGTGHAECSSAKQPGAGNRSPGKWLFLCAFIFSCFLFWWLRSILLQLVLGLQDSVNDTTIETSIIALICFTAGYLFPRIGFGRRHLPATMLDACGDFAYRVTIVLFVPALLLAIGFVETCCIPTSFSGSCALARLILKSGDGGASGLQPPC